MYLILKGRTFNLDTRRILAWQLPAEILDGQFSNQKQKLPKLPGVWNCKSMVKRSTQKFSRKQSEHTTRTTHCAVGNRCNIRFGSGFALHDIDFIIYCDFMSNSMSAQSMKEEQIIACSSSCTVCFQSMPFFFRQSFLSRFFLSGIKAQIGLAGNRVATSHLFSPPIVL